MVGGDEVEGGMLRAMSATSAISARAAAGGRYRGGGRDRGGVLGGRDRGGGRWEALSLLALLVRKYQY